MGFDWAADRTPDAAALALQASRREFSRRCKASLQVVLVLSDAGEAWQRLPSYPALLQESTLLRTCDWHQGE